MELKLTDHWLFALEWDDEDIEINVGWVRAVLGRRYSMVERWTPTHRWGLQRDPVRRGWSASYSDQPGVWPDPPHGPALLRTRAVKARTLRALVGGLLRAPW